MKRFISSLLREIVVEILNSRLISRNAVFLRILDIQKYFVSHKNYRFSSFEAVKDKCDRIFSYRVPKLKKYLQEEGVNCSLSKKFGTS